MRKAMNSGYVRGLWAGILAIAFGGVIAAEAYHPSGDTSRYEAGATSAGQDAQAVAYRYRVLPS